MNGRIYDPTLARFISADPYIQFPENSQSYNRYSYVLNNPLTLTDPSGYFSFKKLFKAAAFVAVAYFTAGAASSAIWGSVAAAGPPTAAAVTGMNIAAGAIGGFAAGVAATGTIEGGLQGAVSGGLFGAIGASFPAGSAESYIGHASAGCVSGLMSGGGCGRGAAAQFLSKWTSNHTSNWGNPGHFIASVVVGGTTSVIGGGKFENGATTAAFGYLFNFCSERSWRCLGANAANATKGVLGGLTMFAGAAICTSGIGCAGGAMAITTGAANLAEAADYFMRGDDGNMIRDGRNLAKEAIRSVYPSANADLAFASIEVLGAGLVLKAPVLLKETWILSPPFNRAGGGLPITRPVSALPGAAFEASGAAWDGANAAAAEARR